VSDLTDIEYFVNLCNSISVLADIVAQLCFNKLCEIELNNTNKVEFEAEVIGCFQWY